VSAIALLFIGAGLVALFIVCAVSVIAGIRRREPGAHIGLRTLLELSLVLTANVVTFVIGTLWYRLRGKPLPRARIR